MDKIYVNNKRKVKEKPEDFFNRLYDHYGMSETYYDKDCNIVQCARGSERSFSDLYKIMKTYYSKITHKQLIKIIYDKCLGNIKYNLIYCPKVQKIVLYVADWGDSKMLFTATYYDYNNYIRFNKIEHIDKFTIYYLYKKLGYSTKEIKEQIKKLKQ